MCRQGASVIQTAVLDRIREPLLRVYVVWVPVLPGDDTAPAQEARSLVPDQRAAHFWDGHGALPRLFSRVLHLPAGCPAWDVYLMYARGVRWTAEAPAPVSWQHQLGGLAAAPPLDGESFAANLRLVLSGRQGKRKQ